MDDEEQFRVPEFMHESLRKIVHELALGDYKKVSTDTIGLTAVQVENALREYGGTLVELPAEGFELDYAHAYRKSRKVRQWQVDLSLWMEDERPSDLTLQLIVDASNEKLKVVIMDLHVM